MSITEEIRSYADTAIEQGKQVIGQASEQASQLVATGITRASDLRAQAGKTLKVETVRGAFEPYVNRAVSTAETLTGVVVETVQHRVVKPVVSLTGIGAKRGPQRTTATTTRSTAAARTSAKPATTRPAKSTTAKKAPAKKAAANTTAKSTSPKATTKSTAKSTAKKSSATNADS